MVLKFFFDQHLATGTFSPVVCMIAAALDSVGRVQISDEMMLILWSQAKTLNK